MSLVAAVIAARVVYVLRAPSWYTHTRCPDTEGRKVANYGGVSSMKIVIQTYSLTVTPLVISQKCRCKQMVYTVSL